MCTKIERRTVSQDCSVGMLAEIQRKEMGAAQSFCLILGNLVKPLTVYKS